MAHPAEPAAPLLADARASRCTTPPSGGDRAAVLERLAEHRLLCAHREGPYGVAHWNREIERLLMAATGREWLPEWYAGRPLIVNSNDPGLGLFNGDTGAVAARRRAAGGLIDDGLDRSGGSCRPRGWPTCRPRTR